MHLYQKERPTPPSTMGGGGGGKPPAFPPVPLKPHFVFSISCCLFPKDCKSCDLKGTKGTLCETTSMLALGWGGWLCKLWAV